MSFNFKEFKKEGLEMIERRERVFSSSKKNLQKKLSKDQIQFVDLFYKTYFKDVSFSKKKEFERFLDFKKLEKKKNFLFFNHLVQDRKDYDNKFNPIKDVIEIQRNYFSKVQEMFQDVNLSDLSSSEGDKKIEETEQIDPEVIL